MKSNFRAISYALLGGLSLGLLQACGGDDDNTTIVPPAFSPSISGKAISADTGEGIGGATVRLRIDGIWQTTTTSGAADHTAGDFRFASSIPVNSAFYIIIDPSEAEYADTYTYGSTVTTDGNQPADDLDAGRVSFDIGNVVIYKAAETSITLLDVDTGEPIDGVGMWAEAASTGNGLVAGTVAAPFIVPVTDSTDASEAGVYRWTLPDHQRPVVVYVNGLVDADGNMYQTLAGDLLQPGNQDGDITLGPNGITAINPADNGGHADGSFVDRTLTSVLPGVNSTIYLRKYNASNLTVNFDLFDDDGAEFTSAGRAIDVQETTSGQVFSAVQDLAVSNRYSITIPYRRDLSFAISSLDLDGDGFKDTQTELVNSAVDRQSGVTSVNLAVVIDELTDFTPLTVRTLEGSVTPGVSAEALVIFNQPVALTGGDNATQARFFTLNLSASAEENDFILPFGTVENSIGDPGGIILTQQAPPAANTYTYTDNTNSAATFTLSGARGSDGRFVEGYEKRVDTTLVNASVAATQVNSAGNIYRVTVTSSAIDQHQELAVAMSVRNVTTGEIENVTITIDGEASTAAFSALSDITIDDGNYVDNAADLPTTNLGSKPLYVNTDTDNLQTIANTDTLGTCGDADCLFVAERAPTLDANVGYHNTISLLSPKSFYGYVQLVDYTVQDLDSAGGLRNTTTETFNVAILVYSEQDELNELTANSTNLLCPTIADCSEQGAYYFHLSIPANHDVDDKAGDSIDDVFGDTVDDFATGYNKPDGLIYAVSLADFGLPTTTTNSILKTVTLDLDIIVDGVRQQGTVTMNVN